MVQAYEKRSVAKSVAAASASFHARKVNLHVALSGKTTFGSYQHSA